MYKTTRQHSTAQHLKSRMVNSVLGSFCKTRYTSNTSNRCEMYARTSLNRLIREGSIAQTIFDVISALSPDGTKYINLLLALKSIVIFVLFLKNPSSLCSIEIIA